MQILRAAISRWDESLVLVGIYLLYSNWRLHELTGTVKNFEVCKFPRTAVLLVIGAFSSAPLVARQSQN